MNQGKLSSLKLLGSVDKIDRELRDKFIHLRNELQSLGIEAEMRVITNSNTKSSIHDRWLLGDNIVMNIPSADVVARGQYSEIKETESTPPYESWWDESIDIVNDWNQIEEILRERLL